MASFVPREIKPVIESGRVRFEVADWVEGQSSTGDQMITITCRCEDESGVSAEIKDHFLLTKDHIFTLGFFSKSIGIYEKYLAGNLERQDVVGKKGICVIRLEEDTSPHAVECIWIFKIEEYLSDIGLASDQDLSATAGKFKHMGDRLWQVL